MHARPVVLSAEGPESTDLGVARLLLAQDECATLAIKIRRVISAVVGIVTVPVDVHELVDAFVGRLALVRDFRIKEVSERFAVRSDLIVAREDGVAACQCVCHDSREGIDSAGVAVQTVSAVGV